MKWKEFIEKLGISQEDAELLPIGDGTKEQLLDLAERAKQNKMIRVGVIEVNSQEWLGTMKATILWKTEDIKNTLGGF